MSIAKYCAAGFLFFAGGVPETAARQLYIAVGEAARTPAGWIGFCADHPSECKVRPTAARDAVLSGKAWAALVRVNKTVNRTVKPLSDMEHWGVVEKWSYPDDGYGDCEDYVLLKRRMLMSLGWPREALLITVVRGKMGNGHAVLTVKTSRGEFILDNQVEEILPWDRAPYRFRARQSQSDPNQWVSLSDERSSEEFAAAWSKYPHLK